MYFLKSPKVSYGINLPTSIEEINIDKLNKITENVVLAPHYALVALVYKTTLFKLAAQVGGSKSDETISVTPIVVKKNIPADVADAPVRNEPPVKGLVRPIIAPSTLERSYEVYVPTVVSVNNVMSYIQNDNDLRIELFQKRYKGNVEANGIETDDAAFIAVDNSTSIYILGFKVVAMNDIVAEVPVYNRIDDPFIYNESDETAND